MSRYFDWTASLKRFVRFDTARSEDVNDALDELTAGLDDLDLDVNRSIKLPIGTADQTLALGAGARANKVLAFDGSGNITVSANSVDSAAASAAAAAASQTAAASSASASSTSASSAASSASSASTSASTATTQAGIATTQASNAAASYDAFDDRYLGNKSSNPTVDNDGAALLTGALYFNTVSNEMRVYTGSAWVSVSNTTSSDAAAASAATATTQAGIATTQAGNASTSATAAATSASSASSSASTATAQAGIATTKASEANASAVAAAASAASIAGGPVTSVNSLTGVVVLAKGDIGLGNVDNTSDATKNSATATLTNKTIALGSNTVSGTLAQFNAAVTDADLASLAGTETLTNKTLTAPTITGAVLNDGYTEEVYSVTGTTPALSPTNGSIQTWTLSGASTPTYGTWAAGQSIVLMITAGANSISWPTTTWSKVGGGGAAPTLTSSGATCVILWKVGTTTYGALLGSV